MQCRMLQTLCLMAACGQCMRKSQSSCFGQVLGKTDSDTWCRQHVGYWTTRFGGHAANSVLHMIACRKADIHSSLMVLKSIMSG